MSCERLGDVLTLIDRRTVRLLVPCLLNAGGRATRSLMKTSYYRKLYRVS